MQIELKNLCLRYHCADTPQDVLQNISLSIDKGESVGIMGRTGCGKTSLVQLIAGLLDPTSSSTARTSTPSGLTRPFCERRSAMYSNIPSISCLRPRCTVTWHLR